MEIELLVNITQEYFLKKLSDFSLPIKLQIKLFLIQWQSQFFIDQDVLRVVKDGERLNTSRARIDLCHARHKCTEVHQKICTSSRPATSYDRAYVIAMRCQNCKLLAEKDGIPSRKYSRMRDRRENRRKSRSRNVMQYTVIHAASDL